jgi:hypothetical protein
MATIWRKTAVASDDPADYADHWALIKGEDGAAGTPGPAGADGRTPYAHIAWAQSVDGKTGFSTTSADRATYLGTCSDFTEADPTDPTAYTWAYFQGPQGVAGKDGVGIKSTQIMYAQSTSGTTAPTTGWTAQVPTLIKGQYLWTQTTWVYTDNTGEAGYTVSYNAKDGNTGANGIAGKDGVGIKSTTITYASSTSGTTAPTSGWTANPPATSAGHYLWTKTVWTYTDGTNETGYSVGHIGADGTPGADGKTPYLHIAYADSADGKDGFYVGGGTNLISGSYDSSWDFNKNGNSTIQKVTMDSGEVALHVIGTDSGSGFYVGFRFPSGNYTASVDVKGTGKVNMLGWEYISMASITPTSDWQRVSRTGSLDGKWHAFVLYGIMDVYVRLLKVEEGSTATPWSPAPSEAHPIYMGTYTDYTQADSLDPTAYLWSLIKGADGADGKDGVPGKAGADGKTPYFHTAYADSGDGRTNFSLDTPGSRKYIGSYTDFTQADSTSPAAYSWQLVQGPKGDTGKDGVAGKDGVGIKSTAVTYQASTSGTTTPTGTWVANPPSVTGGNYLWTRTVWSYTDGTSETGYSVAKAGEKGDKGDTGATGPKGATGATGPAGDDITSYASGTALPTAIAPANSQFWLTNSAGVAIKFYKSTGTAWVEQQISAAAINSATFNGLSFNGVTFNGSVFTTTNTFTDTMRSPTAITTTQTLDKNGYILTSKFRDLNDSNDYVSVTQIDVFGEIITSVYLASDYDPNAAYSKAKAGVMFDPRTATMGMTQNYGAIRGSLDATQLAKMNACGSVLWTGVNSMNGEQTITPSISIDKCLTGWLLTWQEYANGAVTGTGIVNTPLYKNDVIAHSGAGFPLGFINYDQNAVVKYVYPTTTNIKGNDRNGSLNYSKGFVLTKVTAF